MIIDVASPRPHPVVDLHEGRPPRRIPIRSHEQFLYPIPACDGAILQHRRNCPLASAT